MLSLPELRAIKNDLMPQYRLMSYDSARACWLNGGMSDTQWQLYQYIWRNSVVRFSEIAAQYEDKNYSTPTD